MSQCIHTYNPECPGVRITHYRHRLNILNLERKYADWSVSPAGLNAAYFLVSLATLRAKSQMPKSVFDREVNRLGKCFTIPMRDFRLFANYTLEVVRCDLACSGVIPYTPGIWDAEARGW